MGVSVNVFFIVLFFKQKTAYEMRISDWSSDVCSSDLIVDALFLAVGNTEENKRRALWMALVMPFHRQDFGRLMLKRVEPMHVAHKDLNGSDKGGHPHRSEEHTSELQSLMRISYAAFCLKKKTQENTD